MATIKTTIMTLIFFALSYLYLLKRGIEYNEEEHLLGDEINFNENTSLAAIGLYPLNVAQMEVLRENTDYILGVYEEVGGQSRIGYNVFLNDHNNIVSASHHRHPLALYPSAQLDYQNPSKRVQNFRLLSQEQQRKIQEGNQNL